MASTSTAFRGHRRYFVDLEAPRSALMLWPGRNCTELERPELVRFFAELEPTAPRWILGIKPEGVVGLIGLSLVPKTRAAQRIAREQFAPQVPGASPTSEQLRDVRVTTESLRCPCRIDTSAISLETHVSEVEPTVSIQARENCSQWLENVPKDWQVRSKGARADF